MNSLENNTSTNWKTVIVAGGAFAAYNIGAGFATGAEVLQFYGSWGGYWLFLLAALSVVICSYFCSACYRVGQAQKFTKASDAYGYFCGKRLGILFDIFTLVLIFGFMIAMFAGSGATINQYFGIPVYVGAAGMGVVGAAIVCLGLRRVIEFLGYGGVVIVLFVVFVGMLAFFKADTGFVAAQANLDQYVTDGKVMQAGLFGIYNPLFAAINYCGLVLLASTPFLIALGGEKSSSAKEAHASGLFSGLFYFAGVVVVAVAIIYNLDFIVASGAQIPMLAVVQNVLPIVSLFFAFIVVLGILTTVTGYLWLLSGRFAEDKSPKARGIVIVLAIAGVFGGSIIPFGTIINIFYPISGAVGMVLLGFVVAKDFGARKEQKSVACEPEKNAA